MPWLITTPWWPELAAHFAGATARLVATPAVAAGATASAVVSVGALLLRGRARPRPGDRST